MRLSSTAPETAGDDNCFGEADMITNSDNRDGSRDENGWSVGIYRVLYFVRQPAQQNGSIPQEAFKHLFRITGYRFTNYLLVEKNVEGLLEVIPISVESFHDE